MIILSCCLIAVATIAYVIGELRFHGKLIWMDDKNPTGFWGERSDERKYKHPLQLADGWYYRFNEIHWKEKFPLSATLLVSLTDGDHLMQAITLLCISGAVGVMTPNPIYWTIGIRIGIGIIFTLGYKIFGRDEAKT